MSNQGFKADQVQVGPIKRAISATSKRQLFFRDDEIPEGITLKELTEGRDGVTRSELAGVSGYLQDQIDDNSQNIENNYTTIVAVSADLQDQINSLSLSGDITRGEVLAISSNLQAQITSNDNDIAGLVSISGNHENRITLNEIAINGLVSISGDHESRIFALENASVEIDGSQFVSITGDSMSGALEIVGNKDVTQLTIKSISGQIQPIQQWQDENGNDFLALKSNGNLLFDNNSSIQMKDVSGSNDVNVLEFNDNDDVVIGDTLVNNISSFSETSNVINISGENKVVTTSVSHIINQPTDGAKLTNEPSGFDDLAIATVGFVNAAGVITGIEQYVPFGTGITPSSDGIKGQWSFANGYIYICIATNTWIRQIAVRSW